MVALEEDARVAKEGQRILLTPRNPHCGHRNDCDGTRMLSSQYQPRYPAIQAKASSISEAVSDNTNEVSNLPPQALPGPYSGLPTIALLPRIPKCASVGYLTRFGMGEIWRQAWLCLV